MTVILAANLIEGPILASDSRVTQRPTKKTSDTATKIIPLKQDLIIGIAGNSKQAALIIKNLIDEVNSTGIDIISPRHLRKTIQEVAKNTEIVDVQDSRCHLIFAGLDHTSCQKVPIEKLKYYLEKENQVIIGGNQAPSLMLALMDLEFTGELDFNCPRSFIYHLSYPSVEIDEVKVLELDSWGSGGNFVKEEFEREFYKFWDLKMLDNAPFFKKMILTITLEDIIKRAPNEIFIGGLPQIVSIDSKLGLSFQSYTRNGMDGKPQTTMKFMGDHWEQINEQTGKVVRTLPNLLGGRTFDPSEIVDFAI